MGERKGGTRRRRAVGTRDRIMSHLGVAGEVTDGGGMASAVLAAEVGYPGSSIAFAQLLSGMQRSGLIEREVRGKRTYRIAAAAGAADAAARAAAATRHQPARPLPGRGPAAGRTAAAALAAGGDLGMAAAAPGDFDYDELARRLLIQVVRRLATTPGDEQRTPARRGGAGLEQIVAGLEQELASVRTMHGTLTAENARLREQLRAARRSLALAHDQGGGRLVSEQLDAAEVGLLERLLAPAEKDSRGADAETG